MGNFCLKIGNDLGMLDLGSVQSLDVVEHAVHDHYLLLLYGFQLRILARLV
jgi:hypothetical protein